MSQLLSKATVTSCRSSVGNLHGCLQQDGAPSHTAMNTPTSLRRENVTFVEPHVWPPNTPDLNPVDCAVCGVLQQMIQDNQPAEAGRPVESQFGARGNYTLTGPPSPPPAGCLAPESNILCRQWSFGKYSSLYSRGKFRL